MGFNINNAYCMSLGHTCDSIFGVVEGFAMNCRFIIPRADRIVNLKLVRIHKSKRLKYERRNI